MVQDEQSHEQDIQRIIESAERLGVEIDEADALQWLTAIAAAQGEDLTIDEDTGIYGHKVTMLDFSDDDLAHFRKMGKIVEFEDIPGKVETALALSGSAAQSKIQTYPGDADFFERVNIISDTEAEAKQILAKTMRDKILSSFQGPNYEFIEAKFGSFPQDLKREGDLVSAGSPIAWKPKEIKAGFLRAETLDGMPFELTWEQASEDPGWCKLDWVVADPVRKKLVNCSNMLDATWEAPDGNIIPLDGYLDSFFQEVYLEADSIPIFSKLKEHMSSDMLARYVGDLKKEVKKYVTYSPNYGKAAKRMYNIFRLTGKYTEAAYLRELFDEPTSMLYQVWSLIRTVEESFEFGGQMDRETILSQADKLIESAVIALDGPQEIEVLRLLMRFKDLLVRDTERGVLSPQAEAAREEVLNIVNNFFYEKLTGMPEIRDYIEDIKTGKEE